MTEAPNRGVERDALRATPEDELVGRVLDGRYAIEGRLGEGGLGVVYRATQTRLGRPVAVKVLHAEHAKKKILRERFEREARSLARLQHPNIVDVIDYGIEGDAPFLVMELLEGRPLDAAIRAGLSPAEGLAIGRSVVAAVAYAHARGVVHRDLKPANVFLQRAEAGGEVPRVLDFGLAKFLGEATEGDALTRAGAILGTPAYMSPEQATGAASDVRADVYSLGIVLFELLTGTRPFHGSPADLMRMHLLAELPSLAGARQGIAEAEGLDAVLRRATEKSASKRYADAGALLEALAPFTPERMSRSSAPHAARPAPGGDAPRSDAPTLVAETPARAGAPSARAGDAGAATVLVPPRRGAARTGRWSRASVAIAAVVALAVVGLGVLALRAEEGAADGAAVGPVAAERVAQTEATVPTAAEQVARTEATVPTAAERVARTEATVPTATAPAPEMPARTAPADPAAARAREVSAPAPADRYAIPPELEAIRRRTAPGARLSEGDRRALFRYADAHRGDPRAWILMAHLDFAYGARTDALRFYGYALREDPASRAHPTMQRDVVVMAGHRSVGRRAADMVVEVWGAEALPAIGAALREVELDADARRRIEALSATLRSLEGT